MNKYIVLVALIGLVPSRAQASVLHDVGETAVYTLLSNTSLLGKDAAKFKLVYGPTSDLCKTYDTVLKLVHVCGSSLQAFYANSTRDGKITGLGVVVGTKAKREVCQGFGLGLQKALGTPDGEYQGAYVWLLDSLSVTYNRNTNSNDPCQVTVTKKEGKKQ